MLDSVTLCFQHSDGLSQDTALEIIREVVRAHDHFGKVRKSRKRGSAPVDFARIESKDLEGILAALQSRSELAYVDAVSDPMLERATIRHPES
jgi:hypothetical protein